MQNEERTTLLDIIQHRKGTFGGKAVIGETRLSVETILYSLGHGMPVAEVLRQFAPVTQDDVRAALLYAALNVRCGEWQQMGAVLTAMAETLDHAAVLEKHPALTAETVKSCLLHAAENVK